MQRRLRTLLPSLLGRPGRPAALPVDDKALLPVAMAVRDYLAAHPETAKSA